MNRDGTINISDINKFLRKLQGRVDPKTFNIIDNFIEEKLHTTRCRFCNKFAENTPQEQKELEDEIGNV
jgi:hypothetical protein